MTIVRAIGWVPQVPYNGVHVPPCYLKAQPCLLLPLLNNFQSEHLNLIIASWLWSVVHSSVRSVSQWPIVNIPSNAYCLAYVVVHTTIVFSCPHCLEIMAKSLANVQRGRTQVGMIVESGRRKEDSTHFVAISLNQPHIQDRLAAFNEECLQKHGNVS